MVAVLVLFLFRKNCENKKEQNCKMKIYLKKLKLKEFLILN